MRASVDRNDPGYNPAAIHYKAFLNGKEVEHCVTADEDQGYVVYFVKNKLGSLVVHGSRLERRRLRGNVQVKMVSCEGGQDG